MDASVTLARMEREKQGPWEFEVSYGGEADLHQHLICCDKNPGHQKCIPVDKFNVDQLPSGSQDKDVVDLVRATSDLTVRVSVKYVSEGRPETFPGSGRAYPFYKNRGGDMIRVGTGWVWKVNTYPHQEIRYTSCPCQECRISSTPKAQFACIHVLTAAHVVFNDQEAAHTTCHLFFDKGGTPDACSAVVTVRGWSVVDSDVDGDWCDMTFATHDLDLVETLNTMLDHWDSLRERFKDKFGRLETEKQKSSSQKEDQHEALDNLTIIVSHPHGCSKQVSIGYCVDTDEILGRLYPRTYTTDTCPGSSGACVIWVKVGWRGFYWSDNRVHSGNCEGNKALNFCGEFIY